MTDQTQRLAVISRVKTLVLKHHFNIGNVDYGEWCREVDQQSATLAAADEGVFEEGIRALLAKLKSSHTNFYAADVNSTRPQHVIGATLRSVIDSGSPHWMFLDVFEDGPAARAGAAPGQLLVSVDGIPAIPPAFPAFRFGQDHQVTTKLPGQQETRNLVITVPQRKARKGRPPLIEPKSVSHRMLTQRVGLLRVPFFSGSFGIRFSKLLKAAVEDLKAKGCDRLIIDLRGCLGRQFRIRQSCQLSLRRPNSHRVRRHPKTSPAGIHRHRTASRSDAGDQSRRSVLSGPFFRSG